MELSKKTLIKAVYRLSDGPEVTHYYECIQSEADSVWAQYIEAPETLLGWEGATLVRIDQVEQVTTETHVRTWEFPL
jgi:hypothetical protein